MALFNTKQKTLSKTSQNTYTLVILIICALLFLSMCVAGIMSFGQKAIVSGDSIDPSAFDTSKVYYFDDMIYLGEYAYSYENNEDNPTEHFALVAFTEEGSDKVYYASIEVKDSADIMELCNKFNDYFFSETDEFMDTTLKGVFDCNSLESKEKDVRDEYSLFYDYWCEEIPGIDTGINFVYEAADEAAYQENAKTDAIILTAVGAVLTVLCAVGIFFSVRQRKKIKEDIAKLAAVNEAPSYTVNGSENEQ